MPGILSQEEIDQLVSSVSEEKLKAGKTSAPGKKAIPYDFRQQKVIPRDSLRTFQALHSAFAKSLRGFLLRTVKTELTVNLATVDTLPLGEFIKSRANPTYLNLVRLKPYDGNLIVDLSPNLVFLLVDLLFGGTGNLPSTNDIITDMEKKFMRKIVEDMLGEFEATWERVIPFHPKVEQEGIDPSIIGSPADTDTAIMVIYELTLEERSETHHPLSLCYNAKLLKSLVAILGQKKVREEREVSPQDEDQRQKLRRSLGGVEIPLEVKLGETHLTIRDLINLQVGDTIRLDDYISEGMTIEVNKRPKFLGRPGTYRGRMAVVVSSTVKEGEERDAE